MAYVVTQKDKRWQLFNTDSEEWIEINVSKREANKMALRLNLGSGFYQSPVPSFFQKYNNLAEL
jgi:hypothetical protein